MDKCAVKAGFFVLRDCGQSPIGVCSACYRPVCQHHSRERDGAMVCADCFARGEESEEEESREESQEENAATSDGGWEASWDPVSYRHRYFTGGLYGPIYAGSGDIGYYDSMDVRSFDQQDEGEPSEGGEETDTGFQES